MTEQSVLLLDSQSEQFAYRRQVGIRCVILLGLFLALITSVVVDLSIGPVALSLGEVFSALFGVGEASRQTEVVIWEIRLPIALMSVVVGASLAVAGAQMQTILNNSLASPFTLGISAAASFGAALALAFGVNLIPAFIDFVVPINAFVMAMLTALLIYGLSMRQGVGVQTIILLGIALVFSFNALLSLVQYFASAEALSAVVFWTMGSLTKATWPKFFIVSTALLIIVPLFARQAWALTTMQLGDQKAASFGVNVAQIRLSTLLLVSILASIPVSFVGTIGFIGLIGPHIARLLVGEDQRFFLPASLLTGALLLSASSVASKSLIEGAILPMGIVTSIIGIPFFVLLVLSNAKHSQ